METMNAINELLIEAHSIRWSFVDNALAYFTLYLSRLFIQSHYDKVRPFICSLVSSQYPYPPIENAKPTEAYRWTEQATLQPCWPEHLLAQGCRLHVCECTPDCLPKTR